MQILIKVVQGNGFMIDVDENITVLDLKKKIEQRTQHLVEQQTLLLVGRALVDDKQLSFYPNIKEGTKINLVLKKLNKESLNNVLIKFLKNYYSESQSNQICDKFMKVSIIFNIFIQKKKH